MEHKSKISIDVVNCHLKIAAVCVSFSCTHLNDEFSAWLCLRKLKRQKMTSDPQYSKGGEHIALCFSLFEHIKENLAGNPLSLNKFRATEINCELHNGYFNIYFQTSSTINQVLRCLKTIVKSLKPESCFQQYSQNIKNLGGKPNREEFSTCCNDLNKSLDNGIHIVACGNIKLKSEDVLSKVIETLVKTKPAHSEQKPVAKLEKVKYAFKDSDAFSELAVKNNMGIIVADYIQGNSTYSCSVSGKNIIVWSKLSDAKKTALANEEKIKRWVNSKVLKLNDKIFCVYTMFALMNASIDCKSAISFSNSKMSESEITKTILDSLKV